MAFRKGTAGPRFQVSLEPYRRCFGGELHGHEDGPWTVRGRRHVQTRVVPLETPGEVTGQPDVMARRTSFAPDDVDGALLGWGHARLNCTGAGRVDERRSVGRSRRSQTGCAVAATTDDQPVWKKWIREEVRWLGAKCHECPPSPLRGFGGTTVAHVCWQALSVSTPVENLTVPPVENLTDRRGDEPQVVATS